jgi:hypothetical protein
MATIVGGSRTSIRKEVVGEHALRMPKTGRSMANGSDFGRSTTVMQGTVLEAKAGGMTIMCKS